MVGQDARPTSRLQYTKLAIHMSPRWGLRYSVYPACYIHAAPLGLNAAMKRLSSRDSGHIAPLEGKTYVVPPRKDCDSKLELWSGKMRDLRVYVQQLTGGETPPLRENNQFSVTSNLRYYTLGD